MQWLDSGLSKSDIMLKGRGGSHYGDVRRKNKRAKRTVMSQSHMGQASTFQHCRKTN